MRGIRSIGCLAVAVVIAFSSLLSGCSDESKSRKAIIATVDAYFTELESGAFSKSSYASSHTEDNPFSSLTFADEGIRPCLNTALESITYEVTEVEGNTKNKTGLCTLTVTAPDSSKALEGLDKEWVTPELLSDAITSEDSPTVEYEVSLQMEYDSFVEKWMIVDSSALANAIGFPYSELNLYSGAGDPTLALTAFMESLPVGGNAEVAPYLQTRSQYNLLYPSEVDIQIRQAFFEQMDYEIGDLIKTEDGFEVEVQLDFVDLQAVSDRLAQSADLNCEMFKHLFSGLLTNYETTFVSIFETRYVEISLKEITYPDAQRQQENFVFQLEPSDDGQQWQIVGLPFFMKTTEYDSEPADDLVLKAALGMALIELYDEGIITKTVMDEQFEYYGIEESKYSSRKVAESLVGYAFLDLDTLEPVEYYDADTTYQMCYMLEFDQDWPGLTYYVAVFDGTSNEPNMIFEVATDTPNPSIYAGTVGNKEQLWSPGTYTLHFVFENSTLLASMSIEVK